MRNMILILVVSMAAVLLNLSKSDGKCAFEAIFNLGDSNSDTGGYYAAFPPQRPPHGMTYFKRPVGRSSDGRLYIDFLAQALGLPFLSPYLESIGSDYRHGANFATTGSTVLPMFIGNSPFYLTVQLNQMKQFKAKVDEFQSSGKAFVGLWSTICNKAKTMLLNFQRLGGSLWPFWGQTNLPQPDIFGKSLYTIYIGQNDFTTALGSLGIEGAMQYMPQVVSQIAGSIKELYALGGRTFLVLNLAPMGCYPRFLVEFPHESSDIDIWGCMIPYNKAVEEYNNMLKDAVRQTRQDLSDANVVYVDSHSVLLDIIQHPKSHGLQYGTKACCGYGGGAYNIIPHVFCGHKSKVIDEHQVIATACSDPQNYVSWDGLHVTEAANKILAYAILNGSYFDPPFSFHQFCDISSLG